MINHRGYFKCFRSQELDGLLSHNPKAFTLLILIASRARYMGGGFNPHSLAVGEALVGDYKRALKLTEGEYRHAKKYLEKHGFATFKGTPNGTIAKLINTDIFDPNLETDDGQSNGRTTDEQRTNNGLTTTNKKDKKEKKDKKDNILASSGNKKTSQGQMIYILNDKITSQKKEIDAHESKFRGEAAGGSYHWDTGRKEEWLMMKKELKELEEKRDDLAGQLI